MTTRSSGPFVPGAKVAIFRSQGPLRPATVSGQKVDKVHKSGNFVLEGDSQQWRPYAPNGAYTPYWTAAPTGDRGFSFGSVTLRIWDESTDAGIQEAIGAMRRQAKFHRILTRIERAKADQFTDEMLDQIEAALPKGETK